MALEVPESYPEGLEQGTALSFPLSSESHGHRPGLGGVLSIVSVGLILDGTCRGTRAVRAAPLMTTSGSSL